MEKVENAKSKGVVLVLRFVGVSWWLCRGGVIKGVRLIIFGFN